MASESSLSRRALSIRDDAFAALGDRNLADRKVTGRSPKFAITEITDFPACDAAGCKEGQDPDIQRRVSGTYQVPCYLNLKGCGPGGRFSIGANGLPRRTPGNEMTAKFACNIPRSVVQNGVVRTLHPSLYGHGLLGDLYEINSRNVRQLGNENGILVCATDWSGMAEEDIPNVARILQDVSKFPSLADRNQQGFVNFLYLGRLLSHPAGLVTAPALRVDGKPIIDTGALAY